jgi:hypothetical protein
MSGLAGAWGGIVYNLYMAVESNDPDVWKRTERALPTFLKGVSRGTRYFARGEEEFRGGGTVVEFEPNNPEHFMERAMQMFNFAPSRVSERYELQAAQQMMKEYYFTRRQELLDSMNYARDKKDKEGVADVKKEIVRFNATAPTSLRISSNTTSRSRDAHEAARRAKSRGKPREQSLRGPYREIEQAYPGAQEALQPPPGQ